MDDIRTKIAIVGMAGRFPGADSVDSLWRDVIAPGAESVRRIDAPQGGVVGYGLIDGAAEFDNDFFDMSPSESRMVTPEHRLLLECAWAALEDAAIDVTSLEGFASVYASASNHSASYLRRIIHAVHGEHIAGGFGVLLGNAMDSLATRVGYKLGLRGECITVQTHCSSSLVAVHLACQSLLSGHSDLAIAGGVSIRASVAEDLDSELPQLVAQEGFILSPDGQCRALLEDAAGTVSGDGAGAVVLKMLEDALEDGDPIHAVIVGSGINNDGKRKVGFTAPSVDGVTDAIEDALAFAELDPEDIDFIECHGTGTELGDAIELRALRAVFERRERAAKLHLGSLKSNIGHLAAGAGVGGLIKAALVTQHRTIPPLAHARERGPHLQVRESHILECPRDAVTPFDDNHVVRAGVSSLGIGGTNVHILVEEPPRRETSSDPPAPATLVRWTARTPVAAEAMGADLADVVSREDSPPLRDVAFTLREGRAELGFRQFAAIGNTEDAGAALRRGASRSLSPAFFDSPGKVAFVFPGSGAYRPDMAALLWRDEPVFRRHAQACIDVVRASDELDLTPTIAGESADPAPSLQLLQLAVIITEIAVARTLLDWGATPHAVIGSSLGEYAAAHVCGALTLEDVLKLVSCRGRLLQPACGGRMLLVDTDWDRITPHASNEVEEAMRIAAGTTAVSGPAAAIAELQNALETAAIGCRLLPPQIAYHSAAVDRARDEFVSVCRTVSVREPEIPLISNRTGAPIGARDLARPEYWFEQMRHTVLLREGFQSLHDLGVRLFIETGPGHGGTKFAGLNFPDDPAVFAQPTMRHPRSDRHDRLHLLETAGYLWQAGQDVQPPTPGGHRVRLPTYPFERRYFYLGEGISPVRPASTTTDHEPQLVARDGWSTLQRRLAAIWSAVLGVETIGLDDDFFDLGGDSLQATRVLGRIQAEITPEIGVQDVIEHRTIGALADLLLERIPELGADDDGEETFCTFELPIGEQLLTVHLSRSEFDEKGLPNGALNIRILE